MKRRLPDLGILETTEKEVVVDPQLILTQEAYKKYVDAGIKEFLRLYACKKNRKHPGRSILDV